MDHFAVYQSAPTNARSDGEVNRVFQSLRRAPARFSQERRIHIRVERNGNA